MAILTQEQEMQIKELYNNYLKGSLAVITKPFYSDLNYVYVDFYLAGSKEEVYNTYLTNDMFHISFELHKKSDNLFTLVNRSNSYFIKPIYNPWYAYDRHKVYYRKTSGDFNKILKSLDNFFMKLTTQLKEDLNNGVISENNIDCYGRDVSHNVIMRKHLI